MPNERAELRSVPLVCRSVAYSEGCGSRGGGCRKTDRPSSRRVGVRKPRGGWSYRRVTFSSTSVLKTHFTQHRQPAAVTEDLRGALSFVFERKNCLSRFGMILAFIETSVISPYMLFSAEYILFNIYCTSFFMEVSVCI